VQAHIFFSLVILENLSLKNWQSKASAIQTVEKRSKIFPPVQFSAIS
jgi:hypothetical protein